MHGPFFFLGMNRLDKVVTGPPSLRTVSKMSMCRGVSEYAYDDVLVLKKEKAVCTW